MCFSALKLLSPVAVATGGVAKICHGTQMAGYVSSSISTCSVSTGTAPILLLPQKLHTSQRYAVSARQKLRVETGCLLKSQAAQCDGKNGDCSKRGGGIRRGPHSLVTPLYETMKETPALRTLFQDNFGKQVPQR